MDRDVIKDILLELFWFKNQVDDQEAYLNSLLKLAVEINDVDMELTIKNIYAIEGKL